MQTNRLTNPQLQPQGTVDPLTRVRAAHTADEDAVLAALTAGTPISRAKRRRMHERAVALVDAIRTSGNPGLMDLFLSEYGLSTNEGIALMCLAEALLRVPDAGTIDALIDDKITPYDWRAHRGHSRSAVVNAATVGLMFTGRVLDDDDSASVSGLLNRTVKRLGEPVVRAAVGRAMREMGNQFVLGQTIDEALRRGRAERRRGFLYSYDMLGEAALTDADARAYFDAYRHAITQVGRADAGRDITDRPGISIKLSALHPRFEFAKAERLHSELLPRVKALALHARACNMGLNVDAEEASRLEPGLAIVEAALADPELAGWDGFGLVVQAYGKRAGAVIDWLHACASELDRRVMVRLVKGAYWDSEIKNAQVLGLDDYPVFTSRSATDVSYLCCAAKLLAMSDRIYPQFATHNAHTAAGILELAEPGQRFEFQRLHGMGETLHTHLLREVDARCRIYAPVGPHKDLLAYLVRRLLENGANSSFVNQVVDPGIPAQTIAADPFERLEEARGRRRLRRPREIHAPERRDALGWDLQHATDVAAIDHARAPFAAAVWHSEPITAAPWTGQPPEALENPARPGDVASRVVAATSEDVAAAVAAAQPWTGTEANDRGTVLERASDLLEARFGEVFALLAREAGKTLPDAVAELREAVDFLRYYAGQARRHDGQPPLGVVTCIAP